MAADIADGLPPETVRKFREGLLTPLRHSLPVDGVYLFHHGSMEAVGEDDPEGELDREVRALVGPRVPIVVSCDLHANVTRRMVESTDAILGYEHYPHDDVHDRTPRPILERQSPLTFWR